MRERTRAAHVRKVQQLLPGAQVYQYVVGRGGPNPVYLSLGLIGIWLALIVVIAILTGLVVIPGILLFLLIQYALNPPQALVSCDRGFALVNRSLWNGKPTSVRGLAAPGSAMPTRQEAGQFRIQLTGGPHIWLSKREEQRLRTGR